MPSPFLTAFSTSSNGFRMMHSGVEHTITGNSIRKRQVTGMYGSAPLRHWESGSPSKWVGFMLGSPTMTSISIIWGASAASTPC